MGIGVRNGAERIMNRRGWGQRRRERTATVVAQLVEVDVGISWGALGGRSGEGKRGWGGHVCVRRSEPAAARPAWLAGVVSHAWPTVG